MVEIDLIPFKFKHLELLYELLQSQNYIGIANITMDTLPKAGYIALLNNQPIAAGFLRRVEGGFGQIDTLASNTFFGSQVRHAGISAVVDALINDAKTLKMKGIIALSSDKGTLLRAEGLGFHVVNQTVIALPLESPVQ